MYYVRRQAVKERKLTGKIKEVEGEVNRQTYPTPEARQVRLVGLHAGVPHGQIVAAVLPQPPAQAL